MRTSYLCLALLAACVDAAPGEPTAPNQLEGDKADGGPLWAGLVSQTIERYTADPCDDGAHPLDNDPLVYDEWARERAGIRNICFEVWMPGVTDTDNTNYWQQLNVQAHYRFHGQTTELGWSYVPSIDRRGNNRRYAWAIDFSLDPFAFSHTVATVPVPFHIDSEGNNYASVSADLEVTFTVNGQELKSSAGHPFVIHYEGYASEPAPLSVTDSGLVLNPMFTCQGATIGSGAGYFAVDVRDAAAITTLAAGFGGSLIYGASVGRAASVLSTTFLEEAPASGQTLPSFTNHDGAHITPSGTSLQLTLDVYDRALGQTRQLSATFAGCAAN